MQMLLEFLHKSAQRCWENQRTLEPIFVKVQEKSSKVKEKIFELFPDFLPPQKRKTNCIMNKVNGTLQTIHLRWALCLLKHSWSVTLLLCVCVRAINFTIIVIVKSNFGQLPQRKNIASFPTNCYLMMKYSTKICRHIK